MAKTSKKIRLNEQSLRIIVDESRFKLADQLDSVKSLDSKAAIIMSFSGVILTLLLTSDSFTKGSRFTPLIGAFIFLAALLSLIVLLVRSYRRDPEPRNFYTGYANKGHIATLEVLAGSFIASYEKNTKKILVKKWLVNASFISLGIASLLLLVKLIRISGITL